MLAFNRYIQSGILKKASTAMEYAAVVAALALGLVAMQSYLQRGVQGKLKASADNIGDPYDPAAGFTSNMSIETKIHTDVSSSEGDDGKLTTTTMTEYKKDRQTYSQN